MADSTNTTQSSLSPSEITTAGTGDGSEASVYNEAFGLATSDGSGNPPEDEEVSSNQKSFYNKDLDLVQNMRNCFAVVSGFKSQVDSIVLASGYGGWIIITESVDPEDRIEGLMYLRVVEVTDGTNADGQTVPRYKLYPELHTGVIMSFFSDAEISVYDNGDAYFMSSITVKDAIDELSRRSIITKVTVKPDDFKIIAGSLGEDEEYTCAEVEAPEILATDYPSVTLQPSETDATAAIQIADAGHISRIQTLNGKVKVYCYDGHKPTRELPLVFRIHRGGTLDEAVQ